MGIPPIMNMQDLIPLKHWLDSHNNLTLYEISLWDERLGRWMDWNLGDLPPPLATSLQVSSY